MKRAPARRGKVAAPAVVLWRDTLPAGADGLAWGLALQRYVKPSDWPKELATVPEQHRARAEDYLRGIAARMRYLRSEQGQRDIAALDAERRAQYSRA